MGVTMDPMEVLEIYSTLVLKLTANRYRTGYPGGLYAAADSQVETELYPAAASQVEEYGHRLVVSKCRAAVVGRDAVQACNGPIKDTFRCDSSVSLCWCLCYVIAKPACRPVLKLICINNVAKLKWLSV